MTEQKVRTRLQLKPVLYVAVGVIVVVGILWLSGFFGSALNIFNNNTDIRKSRGLHDNIDQGTDVLLTQAEAPISGVPDVLVSDPKLGNVTTPLRIVIFGSLTSGYTAGAYDVINSIRADYPNQVQIVWKDLFDRDDQMARDLATAARCANQQDKFWEYVGGVFNQTGGLPKVVVDDVAKNVGLDLDAFHVCLTDAVIASQIDHNLSEATNLHVREVPVWFVGTQPIDGLFPYSWMKPVIDERLP